MVRSLKGHASTSGQASPARENNNEKSGGRYRAAVIAVDPVTEEGETRRGHHPPNNAQPGGSQPWSIQQNAAHITATLARTPYHGLPKRTFPAASVKPWAGKYIDM